MDHIELSGEQPPTVHIENVGGDLRIRGWERFAIQASGDDPQVTEAESGAIHIRCGGDLSLRVPMEANVHIATVGSDAKITDALGALTIDTVGSDLSLRNVGPLTVGTVGSDLRVKHAQGAVRVGSAVGNDATVREVAGSITLEAIGADLYVHNVGGACQVGRVGGDIVLSTAFLPDHTYTFRAGGDIVCRVPPEADVCFRAPSDSRLELDASDAEVIEGADGEEVVFGEGRAVVELEAGGEIRLVGQDEDYTIGIGFAQEIEARINEQLAGLDEQLAGLDDVITTHVEHAVRKAERAARKLERQAEREAKRVARAANKRKRHFRLDFAPPLPSRSPRPPRAPHAPRTPEPPGDPVTNEERLMILRLLEEKKITVDEAEDLLAALEGR